MSKTSFLSKLSSLSIFTGLAIRLYLITLPGHIVDMPTFNAWGHHMLSSGPLTFFDKIWTDYLPLPLYFTALIKFISIHLNISFDYLFKFTFTTLELSLILAIAKNLKKSTRQLWLIMTILSPALILNTSWWGQIDTIPTLLTVLALTLLVRNQTSSSAFLYAIAVGIKPIMLLALPAFIITLIKNKNFTRFSMIALIIFLLPALPPSLKDINSPLGFIIEPFRFMMGRALEQASTYPYQTINAFNLWFASGGNWLSDSSTILSVSAHSLGLFIFATATGVFVYNMRNIPLNLRNLSLLAALPLLLYFAIATRMHERHMLYALPFLLLAAPKFKSKTTLIYSLLSTSYSLNLLAAYLWVANDNTWPFSDSLMYLLSALNVASATYLLLAPLPAFTSRVKAFLTKNYKVLIIVVLALILRLYNLSSPTHMVFDEVYHAFTAREMLLDNQAAWEWWNTPPEGFAYEWTHPPIAKYFMVIGMLLFGENPLGWRFFSAIFGSLSIYLIYIVTRKVLEKDKPALLAALILTFEGLHLSQSRIAMNDIYMISFMLATLYLALIGRWKLSAMSLGLTIASKWSGIYTLIPLALIYLSSHKLTIHNTLNSIRLVLIAIFVYVLAYLPFFEHHDFNQFRELQRQMWHYHTNLDATHDYQSRPHEWVLSLRPVWFSVDYLGDYRKNTYAQSNPAVAWLGIAAIIYALFYKSKKSLLPLIGYLSFLLPWIFSPRPMFFYHYLPSMVFLVILLSHFLSKFSARFTYSILGLIVIVFVILSPLYIGYKMPLSYWDTLFTIFPSWR